MNLYTINQEIESLVDHETGEILDFEAFQQLQMDRQTKIENIACWIKNLLSDAEQLKVEKDKFAERETAAKNKAEQLKTYLSEILQGEPFNLTNAVITYRKSSSVEVDDKFIQWAKDNAKEYLNYGEPKIDKALLKEDIKAGRNFEFARIVEKQNMSIK